MRLPSRIGLGPRTDRPLRPSFLHHRLHNSPQTLSCRRKRHPIRASSEESSSGQSRKWNPFKQNTSKQEAAEKALRDAMGDRSDVLAQFDTSDDDGGSDGGGSSGGGWNWNWNWDDWRHNFGELGQMMLKWLSGVGETAKAIFVCALIIFTVSLIAPAMSAVSKFMRVLLRLESAEDVYGEADQEPAGMQRSVLFSDDEEEEEVEKPRQLSEAGLRRKERRERQRMRGKETAAASKK